MARPSRSAQHPPAIPAPPRLPVRRQRPTVLVVVGILAICLGALGASTLYLRTTHSQEVLRISRTVVAGATITAADLSIVSLPPTPGLEIVPAERLSEVVGHAAARELHAGALLHPTDTASVALPAGTVTVGLRLPPGHIPERGIVAGGPITIVAVPGASAAVDKADATFRATAVTVPHGSDDGTWLLDVAVSPQDAQRVARLGAVQQLSVIKDSDR